MGKKDREGMSRREMFRDKRRRSAQRSRLISIGLIILGALLVAFVLIYPQVKPVADIRSPLRRWPARRRTATRRRCQRPGQDG